MLWKRALQQTYLYSAVRYHLWKKRQSKCFRFDDLHQYQKYHLASAISDWWGGVHLRTLHGSCPDLTIISSNLFLFQFSHICRFQLSNTHGSPIMFHIGVMNLRRTNLNIFDFKMGTELYSHLYQNYSTRTCHTIQFFRFETITT